MRSYATNADLLQHLGAEQLAGLVYARLCAIRDAPREAFLDATPSMNVQAGLMDPVRVFVKNELHSSTKVQQGRMRLIMSISVVDQLVERVLNAVQNNTEIAQYENLPSRPGMGLNDYGLALTGHRVKTKFRCPTASDVSGFDWSVPQWLIDLDSFARAELAGCSESDNMWWRRGRLLGHAQIVLSDGTCFDQVQRGIQKSGSYNTSSGNSRMRAMLAWMVAANGDPSRIDEGEVMAMGDDSIEEWPADFDDEEDLVNAYARYGFTLKEVERGGRAGEWSLSFCAYRFTFRSEILRHGDRRFIGAPELTKVAPERAWKMIGSFFYRAQGEEDARGKWAALLYELRHAPSSLRARVASLYRTVFGVAPPDVADA